MQVIALTDPNVASFIVPSNWNPNNNTIKCIGAGGAGNDGYASGSGGGGGGGGYSSISNIVLSPAASVSLHIGHGGAHGFPGTAGGDTWFNGTSMASCSVGAKGGARGNLGQASLGGQSSAGVGSTKYSGGNGSKTVGAQPLFGGGGGGAAGPNGNGGAAVNSTNGGAGDNGSGGVGGTVGSTPGADGAEWTQTSDSSSVGAGGGASGAYQDANALAAGRSGAGGGGGGKGVGTLGSDGANGVIVISYEPLA